MNDNEKRLFRENIKAVEIRAKYLYRKYAMPNEDFEEFFQNACVFIGERIHKYDGRKGFSTFVDSVLENAFIDRLRVTTKRNLDCLSLDECSGDENEGTPMMEFLHADCNTENEVLSAITEDMVKSIIEDVRKKCTSKTTVKGFDALELKIQGYTAAEIAKIFNVPSNSLRMWISRAKKLLIKEKTFTELLETL